MATKTTKTRTTSKAKAAGKKSRSTAKTKVARSSAKRSSNQSVVVFDLNSLLAVWFVLILVFLLLVVKVYGI